MNDNHKLGLYVSYYLARFNKVAYQNLEFGNQKETHLKIGSILGVNPNTVKNWRDEFDPLFGHRVGWYQRPLSASRIHVSNALGELSEAEVRSIVYHILSEPESREPDIKALINVIDEEQDERKGVFVLRAPTGRKAEEVFIEFHKKNAMPVAGILKDTRDLGCGYDFEISDSNQIYCIEVKGVNKSEGGILLTNKEWETAKQKKERYIIALISDIQSIPKIRFIQNPYKVLNPKVSISTIIQVNWNVPLKQLKDIL